MYPTFLQNFHNVRCLPRALLLIGPALLWYYWPTLSELARRWSHDPKYSHGYIVPFFALYLGWSRLRKGGPPSLSFNWWAVSVVGVGVAIHLFGVAFYVPWMAEISLLPMVAGLVFLLSGWQALKLTWQPIAFLIFMMPMPYRLEVALAQPLQRIGTIASTYALQTLGFTAHAEGNVIALKQIRIGVIEACSGLSMLMIFLALCTAVVLLVRRPLLDKILILFSAVPIALVCNIVRITITGAIHVLVGERLANLVFHDLAGWLMIVLALGILWLELTILDWVLVKKHFRRRGSGQNVSLRMLGIRSSRSAPSGVSSAKKTPATNTAPGVS